MMNIQLVDIEAHNGSGVVTLRFSTHPYVTERSDTPADTLYLPRITEPILLRRVSSEAGGNGALSVGDLKLANGDGALDALVGYAYAGRPVTVKLVQQGAALSTAVTLFTGVMEQPLFDWQTDGGAFVFRVRDKTFAIEQPLQANKYGGTNALPSGVDGGAELKGKFKPRLFGQCFNLPAPCVNTTRLIYQVSDGAVADVTGVYDLGAALSKGADYASQADMEATSPSAGQYRVWKAGGMFRIGSIPAGLVTADAIEGSGAANYPGSVASRVLVAAGVSLANVVNASVIDTAFPYPVGYWCPPERDVSANEVLRAILDSIGAFYAVDVSGKFRFGVMTTPAATSVLTLNADNIIRMVRQPGRDDAKGIPAYSINLGYARYWSVQTTFAGAVSEAVRADLRQEYRTVSATDTAIQTQYPAAAQLTLNTALASSAGATAVAALRLTDRKVRRDRLMVTCRTSAGVDIGDVVTIQMNRYGFNAGKKFLVVGIDLDPRIGRYNLTLWG